MTKKDDKAEIDELAGRYLDLWQKHLAALASDGEVAELVAKSVELMNSSAAAFAAMNLGIEDNAGSTAGNPWLQAGFPTVFQTGPASAGAAHGDPDHDVDELARRVAELEKRVAEMEPKLEPKPARRRKGSAKQA